MPLSWSAADPNRISPVGDEVAPFRVARHSGIPATSAVFTHRAFGCGGAALRSFGCGCITLRTNCDHPSRDGATDEGFDKGFGENNTIVDGAESSLPFLAANFQCDCRLTNCMFPAQIAAVQMTTANRITLGRIALVPVFAVILLAYIRSGAELYRWLSIALLAIMAIGDVADGYIARRFGQQTEIGSLLDPLADKLLLTLALVILSLADRPHVDRIPLWLTATVLCRDAMLLLIVVAVGVRIGQRAVHPRPVGKAATVLQLACVFGSLLQVGDSVLRLGAVAAVLCTLISGALYLLDGLNILRQPSDSAK